MDKELESALDVLHFYKWQHELSAEKARYVLQAPDSHRMYKGKRGVFSWLNSAK